MIVLGIETSCDETAVAVVRDDGTILSNQVLSEIKQQQKFGGVVPEIAARAHLDHLDVLIKGAIREANLSFAELDGVAATCGPGLIGGVMVGMMAGKAIAAAHDKPFLAINHLEAHALTPRLTDKIDCPYLLLLVSGGHTQLLAVEDVGVYKRLGTTLDDALGECFDKSARMMGLPHPGGRYLEKAASHCKDPDAALTRFPLPHPMRGRPDPDFSFSGLKTAVRQHAQNLGTLTPDDIADLAYAFQRQAALIVCERTSVAIDIFINKYNSAPLVVSGGVAANQTIRNALKDLAYSKNMEFIAPPLNLCSDNGAMIAWAGIEKLKLGQQDPLDVAARPRWPLDPTADAKPGAGIKA